MPFTLPWDTGCLVSAPPLRQALEGAPGGEGGRLSTQATGREIGRLGQDLWSPGSRACAAARAGHSRERRAGRAGPEEEVDEAGSEPREEATRILSNVKALVCQKQTALCWLFPRDVVQAPRQPLLGPPAVIVLFWGRA